MFLLESLGWALMSVATLTEPGFLPQIWNINNVSKKVRTNKHRDWINSHSSQNWFQFALFKTNWAFMLFSYVRISSNISLHFQDQFISHSHSLCCLSAGVCWLGWGCLTVCTKSALTDLVSCCIDVEWSAAPPLACVCGGGSSSGSGGGPAPAR